MSARKTSLIVDNLTTLTIFGTSKKFDLRNKREISYCTVTGISEHYDYWIKPQAVNLSGVEFKNVKFVNCNLSSSNFSNATFINCTFDRANLNLCDLSNAYFNGCTFSDSLAVKAITTGTSFPNDLTGLNLSHTTYCNPASKPIILEILPKTSEGIICYKVFGAFRDSPKEWVIAPGSELAQQCDTNPNYECSYGIHVATPRWIERNIPRSKIVWECLIKWRDVPSIVVPIESDGKFRCNRLQLVKPIGYTISPEFQKLL